MRRAVFASIEIKLPPLNDVRRFMDAFDRAVALHDDEHAHFFERRCFSSAFYSFFGHDLTRAIGPEEVESIYDDCSARAYRMDDPSMLAALFHADLTFVIKTAAKHPDPCAPFTLIAEPAPSPLTQAIIALEHLREGDPDPEIEDANNNHGQPDPFDYNWSGAD